MHRYTLIGTIAPLAATLPVTYRSDRSAARRGWLGRYSTDTDGYQAMLVTGRHFPERVWAVEGCNGIGRHIAQRLVADGETVVDVPAKLSARVRRVRHRPGPQDRPGRRA